MEAINCTPHEKFFNFPRRSPAGFSLPSWLVPGPVLLRKCVRASKNDDLVDKVELIDANPTFASIRYPDGRESTVSLHDLAPCPPDLTQNRVGSASPVVVNDLNTDCSSPKEMIVPETLSGQASADVRPLTDALTPDPVSAVDSPHESCLRRSSRDHKLPAKYSDYVLR